MRQKSGTVKEPAEKVVKDIRRVTRKRRSAEQKIRIVLSELRGDGSIAAPCRREGIAQCPSYSWSSGDMCCISCEVPGVQSRREPNAPWADSGTKCTPPGSRERFYTTKTQSEQLVVPFFDGSANLAMNPSLWRQLHDGPGRSL
jgi:hypothetical protein